MSDITKEYYKKNFDDLVESSLRIDVSSLYHKFLPLIPKGSEILDAGCGSGRDSLYFSSQGYKVIAIDNSEEFVDYVKSNALKAYCISFNEINYVNKFDGIWACSSLLHLDEENLLDAIKRLEMALKPNGILYTSFKYGTLSEERNGRFFNDMNEEKFINLISKSSNNLEIIDLWITDDARKERVNQKWLNSLIKKTDKK